MNVPVILIALAASTGARAAPPETMLHFESNPPGARVEMGGELLGVTPFSTPMPRYMFRTPRSLFDRWLLEPIFVTIKANGYRTRNLAITDGPNDWNSLNGQTQGQFYRLRTSYFVSLEPNADGRRAVPINGSGYHGSSHSGTESTVLEEGPVPATQTHDTAGFVLLGDHGCVEGRVTCPSGFEYTEVFDGSLLVVPQIPVSEPCQAHFKCDQGDGFQELEISTSAGRWLSCWVQGHDLDCSPMPRQ